MIGPLARQARIAAFDLFTLALQTVRDLHFDQTLNAHRQRQQVRQSRALIILADKDWINPDSARL